MLEAASQLFQDYKECEFSDDIGFLNELMIFNKEWKLQNTDPTENRKRMLEVRDEVEERRRDDDTFDQNEEVSSVDMKLEDKQFKELININAAFKTIQIMGQILRNFGGSTPGDLKYELARNCNALGLRILSCFLRLLGESKDILIEKLMGYIKQKKQTRKLMIRLEKLRGLCLV